MAKSQSPNPFYFLLLVIGFAFVVTACAYGVMAFRQATPEATPTQEQGSFVAFLDEHGSTILIAQVVLLGLCTFGAIKTDEFWQRRGASQRQEHSQPQAAPSEERVDHEAPRLQ